MKIGPCAVWLACMALPGLAPLSAQEADEARPAPSGTTGTLEITGDVRSPVLLTLDDIAARPHAEARMTSHETTLVYRGVPLHDLLTEAGLPEGGDVVRTVVIAGASDGYTAVFSLAELDPEFTDRIVLVADSVGGEPLPADRGPLRLVVPGEREGARAVWSLSRLVVRTLR